MPDSRVYDAIVIGAGPAGLGVASELSRDKRVLVIDKKHSIGDTTKSWFVPDLVVHQARNDIEPYLYEGVKRFLTNTASGPQYEWDAYLPGGYKYIREHGLLERWGEEVVQNGSEYLLDCFYRDHQVEKDYVRVLTSKGIFTGRVLVDASGHDSMVRKKYEIDEDYYWWSVYGCLVDHPEGLDPSLKVGDYMLWATFDDTVADPQRTLQSGRPVMEWEVLDERTSFPMILYLRKHKMPQDFMKQEFFHIFENSELTVPFRNTKVTELKYGWYPSEGLSQNVARDRVVFIGDAGCWSSPCGWGMAFILNNYVQYATRLKGAIEDGNLDRCALENLIQFDNHDKHQMLLNRLAMRFISNAPSPDLDTFIEFFDKLGFIYCEKTFTLTPTQEDFQVIITNFLKTYWGKDLLQLLPPSERKILVQEAGRFVADFFVEKVKKLTGRQEVGAHDLVNPFNFL